MKALKINLKLLSLGMTMALYPFLSIISNYNSSMYLVVSAAVFLVLLVSVIASNIVHLAARDTVSGVLVIFATYLFIRNIISFGISIEVLKQPIIIATLLMAFLLSKYLTIRRRLLQKHLFMFAVWSVLVTFLVMIFDYQNGVIYYSHESFSSNRSLVGNFSKLASVLFIPAQIFIYTMRNSYAAVTVLLLLWAQRRSILIAEIMFFIFVFVGSALKKGVFTSSQKKIIVVVFSVMAIIVMYTGLSTAIMQRMAELATGSASGRTVFWAMSLQHYIDYNEILMLFGDPGKLEIYLQHNFGHKIGAHNDILDYANNYGVIGVVLLVLFVLSGIYEFSKSIGCSPRESIVGMGVMFSSFFVSFVTGGLIEIFSLMMFVFMGFLYGTIELHNRDIMKNV